MQGPGKERAERRPAASASFPSSSSSSYLAAEHQDKIDPYTSYKRRNYDNEVLLQQQQQLQQQQYQMAALAQQMGQTTLSSGQGYSPSVNLSTIPSQHLSYQSDGSLQHNLYVLPPNAESIGAYNNNFDVTSGAYSNGRTMMTTNFRQQPTTDGYLNQSMMPHHSLYSQGMNYNSFPSSSSSSSAATTSSAAPVQFARSPRQQFSDTLRRGVQSFAYNPMTGSSTESKREGPPIMSSSSSTAPSTASLPARPDSAIIRAANLAGEAADTMAHSPSRANISSAASTVPSGGQGGGGGSPPSAPTVPLTLRFPALPPKPDENDGDDISTLKKKFEAREEALILRIEALGFQPESAWQALEEVEGKVVSDKQKEDTRAETEEQRETAAPILGIRLLQKVDSLQRENDELAKIFTDKMTTRSTTNESDKDMHRLIHALDKALSQMTERAEQAEANVSRLEQTVAVACLDRSSSIVPNDGISTRAD